MDSRDVIVIAMPVGSLHDPVYLGEIVTILQRPDEENVGYDVVHPHVVGRGYVVGVTVHPQCDDCFGQVMIEIAPIPTVTIVGY